MISMCEDHDVRFLFLPSTSTELTQPLDVNFLQPLKIK